LTSRRLPYTSKWEGMI